jgi:serine/threonine-protein kinase ATR
VEDALDDQDSQRHKVEAWLARIPQKLMAEASFRCKAFARALMHYEQHIRERRDFTKEQDMQSFYAFLQKIYSQMDESDGMEGISSLIIAATLDQQILEHESAGRWEAAHTGFEISLRKSPNSLETHIGLLGCLKNLGHLGMVLDYGIYS